MAKKNGSAGEIRLVRQNRESKDVSPRKRGRPHPDFENGYLDAHGEFHSGQPRGPKRRRGRPKGSKSAAHTSNGANSSTLKLSKAGGGAGIAMIEAIVRREVDARMKVAREAAVAALNKALGG